MAAFAFGISVGPFTQSWYYVCRECGALRHTREKQLPWTAVTWWSTHRLEETPLCRLLRESGFAGPHEHEWFPGEGSGNGVSYGFGGGREMRKDAESRHVVSFLRHLAHRGNREVLLEWKAIALSVKQENPAGSRRPSWTRGSLRRGSAIRRRSTTGSTGADPAGPRTIRGSEGIRKRPPPRPVPGVQPLNPWEEAS